MRFLILLLLVAIIGVAIWRNWLTFSRTEGPGDSKVGVNVSVDRDKFKKDIENVKERIASETSKTASPKATVNGRIEVLDPQKTVATIASSDNKQLTVEITAATQVRMGEQAASREDLRQGQEVRCVHTTKDGRQLCEEIVILADFE